MRITIFYSLGHSPNFLFSQFLYVKDFALKNNTTPLFHIDRQTFTNIFRVTSVLAKTVFFEEAISYEKLCLTCVIGQF